MANQVNPPPQLRIPSVVFNDPEWLAYEQQRDIILFQLYQKLGGTNDPISGLPDIIDEVTINSALATRPAHLFNQQSQINEASDRIEANEIDLSTRPRMADLFKVNQKVDELIDELIEQLEKLNTGSEAQQQTICLQQETLKQMKLLNLRTEEAFNTKLDEGDIE